MASRSVNWNVLLFFFLLADFLLSKAKLISYLKYGGNGVGFLGFLLLGRSIALADCEVHIGLSIFWKTKWLSFVNLNFLLFTFFYSDFLIVFNFMLTPLG